MNWARHDKVLLKHEGLARNSNLKQQLTNCRSCSSGMHYICLVILTMKMKLQKRAVFGKNIRVLLWAVGGRKCWGEKC